MNWYSINTDGDTALVNIFSDIGCYGKTSSDFIAALGSPRRAELCISSAGGDGICALNVFHALKDMEVEVTITDKCWSAATVIAMAGKVIRMHTDATMMIHPPSLHAFGTAEQLRSNADRLDGLKEEIIGVISGRTGRTEPVVREWHGTDTWLSAKEAFEAGLVDELVEPVPMVRPSVISPAPILAPGPTDDERFIQAILAGMGTVQVSDRVAFGRWMTDWCSRNVK
jgi:ATP-dependent protease ClpP protease subunit